MYILISNVHKTHQCCLCRYEGSVLNIKCICIKRTNPQSSEICPPDMYLLETSVIIALSYSYFSGVSGSNGPRENYDPSLQLLSSLQSFVQCPVHNFTVLPSQCYFQPQQAAIFREKGLKITNTCLAPWLETTW